MYRYCPNCKKEFDFPIKNMKDLDNLLCPLCLNHIDKNSRKPVDNSYSEKTEMAIGNAFATFCRICYIFYVSCSITGLIAFFLKYNLFLYIVTGISLAVYLIQLLLHCSTFKLGMIFLPLGAAAGFFLFKSIAGACAGICIVFIIRHLIREFFFWIIRKLINLANK